MYFSGKKFLTKCKISCIMRALRRRNVSCYPAHQLKYNMYELYNIDWAWTDIAIYADMTDTIELLGIKPIYTPPTVMRNDKDVELPIYHAVIYDTRELQYSGYENRGYNSELSNYNCKGIDFELAEALARLVAWYNESGNPNVSVFTAIDTDYILRIAYGDYPEDINSIPEDYYVYDEYGLKSVEVEYVYSTKEYGDYATNTYLFPKGYVPESVKALFN